MIMLSGNGRQNLSGKPETSMGYQVVSIILKDGTRFDQLVVVEGRITQTRGHSNIPFTEDQIAQIIVTHDKWNFGSLLIGFACAASDLTASS